MLTPAEELGLSGLSLASRVRKAFLQHPRNAPRRADDRRSATSPRTATCVYLRDGEARHRPRLALPA